MTKDRDNEPSRLMHIGGGLFDCRAGLRLTVGFLLLASTIAGGRAQAPEQSVRRATPPMPFEDVGACPFEGCVYREWIANSAVVVSTDRRVEAPVAFTLKQATTCRPSRVLS